MAKEKGYKKSDKVCLKCKECEKLVYSPMGAIAHAHHQHGQSVTMATLDDFYTKQRGRPRGQKKPPKPPKNAKAKVPRKTKKNLIDVNDTKELYLKVTDTDIDIEKNELVITFQTCISMDTIMEKLLVVLQTR